MNLKSNEERLLLERFTSMIGEEHVDHSYSVCNYILLIANNRSRVEIPDFSGAILQSNINTQTAYSLFYNSDPSSDTLKNIIYGSIHGKSKEMGDKFLGIGTERLNQNRDQLLEEMMSVEKYDTYLVRFKGVFKEVAGESGVIMNSTSFTVNTNLITAMYQDEVDAIESVYRKIGEDLYYRMLIMLDRSAEIEEVKDGDDKK